MPRESGAYGRPNTTLLPPQWAEHVGRTAQGTHTARCEVRAASGSTRTYDNATRRYVDTPGTLAYSGPCRVQRINREQVHEVGQQDVTTADYLVQIDDPDALVLNGMVVTFQQSTDPLLLTKTLHAVNVLVGSHSIGRDLFCTDDQS